MLAIMPTKGGVVNKGALKNSRPLKNSRAAGQNPAVRKVCEKQSSARGTSFENEHRRGMPH
jgi:hypothetical protein